VEASAEFLFDLFKLLPDLLGPRFPANRVFTPTVKAADVGKSQKIECFGFTFSPMPSVFGCKTAKLYQACLGGMQFQAKPSQTGYAFLLESQGVLPVLESHHYIICVAYNYYLSSCLVLSP
jgi:hypothetical protein